jgi:hypothetical protein
MIEALTKLTATVYKLLKYFPESDPLKNRAKEKALEILEKINNGKSEDIDILLSYFFVAKNQGWMSDTNYLIIFSEYQKIKQSLSVEKKTKTSVKPVLNNTEPKTPHFSLTHRQGKIIEFLKGKEKAQVMDFQSILPNVTKRTIRRDLDELLKMGQIDRTGEFNSVSYQIVKMS